MEENSVRTGKCCYLSESAFSTTFPIPTLKMTGGRSG